MANFQLKPIYVVIKETRQTVIFMESWAGSAVSGAERHRSSLSEFQRREYNA